jgi:hypothetical protein
MSNVACAWKLVHMQAPDEQVDPAGHYRSVSIHHLSNKNIALTYNVATFPAIIAVRVKSRTSAITSSKTTVGTFAGT